MFRLIFVIILIIENSLEQQSESCPSPLSTECVSTLEQTDCSPTEILVSNEGLCDLCPMCITGGVIDSPCSIQLCLPGFICDTDASKLCKLDRTQCLHLNYLVKQKPNQKEPYIGLPECDRDTSYKPIQCKGDRATGRCFCISEQGERIFGWDWWSKIDHMTCSCSRKRHNKEMNGKLSTLHCTPNGNYEQLQCEHDICWCAEPKTGDLQEGTAAVPYSLWTFLPCYNATQMGLSYLRQCESSAIAQQKILEKLKTHGVKSITMQNIICDYDGTYGSYMINSGSAVCIWRDGSRIGSFQAPANQAADMNCNCARDTKIFEENHKAMTMACGGNGNYDSLQQINQEMFCIDRDGYPVSGLLPLTPTPNCDEYLYYKN